MKAKILWRFTNIVKDEPDQIIRSVSFKSAKRNLRRRLGKKKAKEFINH